MEISSNQVKFLNLTAKLNIDYEELKKEIQKNELSQDSNDVYFKLNAAQLTEYASGKEQYVIVDMSDKVYGRPDDVSNYVSSKNLMEFLGKYGIVDYEQIQSIYDTLYSSESGSEGLALQIEDLQANMPAANKSQSWAKEPENTLGTVVYTNMLDKVTATLNNVSHMFCSCCFNAIADMLSYTDVASVTNEEIYEKFKDVAGFEYQDAEAVFQKRQEESRLAYEKSQQEKAQKQAENELLIQKMRSDFEAKFAELKNSQNVTVSQTDEISKAENIEQISKTADIQKFDTAGNTKPVKFQVVQEKSVSNYSVTSSTGEKFEIPFHKSSLKLTDTINKKGYIITNNTEMQSEKRKIDSETSRARNEIYAAERLEALNSDDGLSVNSVDLSNLSIRAKRLFSNYVVDSSGNYVLDSDGTRQLKTLRQKIVDTYYIAKNYNSLGISQGEVLNNDGDVKNKETDTTVRGAIKSVQKDIQKALGVESFDYDKYLSDYSKWADEYANLRENYDKQYKALQESQIPKDLEKASWYTNVWTSLGGEPIKSGEDVVMNITDNDADHGHHHGRYSNELNISFDIPDKIYKKSNYVALTDEQLNSEQWLQQQMKDGKIKVEKYTNKEKLTETLSDSKSVEQNKRVTEHARYTDSSKSKELEQLKNLLKDKGSLNDYM